MDDELALPTTTQALSTNSEQLQEIGSDDEDGAPDWTKFLASTSSKQSRANGPITLPKRGEKEYEPSTVTGLGEGSNLQSHILSQARNAMMSVLRTAERKSISKAMSFGVWDPQISRSYVTIPRGILWNTMGHSAPHGKRRRLELLPEETLYMIERGNLWCTLEGQHCSSDNANEEVIGPPISAEQAFTSMIGREGLTLERYQVYAYLKRLGYIVTRTTAPNDHYPVPPPFVPQTFQQTATTFWQSVRDLFVAPFRAMHRLLALPARFNWWSPLSLSLSSTWTYPQLYASMRSIPLQTGHSVKTLYTQDIASTSPYLAGPFFNVWKPGTTYRKSQPDKRPDFQICVVDARTSQMPSLQELEHLYDLIDPAPPPPTRRPASQPVVASPWHHRFLYSIGLRKDRPKKPQATGQNPFPHLRQGSKMAIVAVVDSGSVGFFRFGRGMFGDWPMNFGA
ncbi:hypothetical protein DL96DRAFT_1579986 [Flagelloscypha sp. PMI_526]|nr:hypothetical protein DL96DRAFT_1579986 [Flagelloscypha sp. PMI_526]